MTRDEDHLRVLSIFYYVIGGIVFLSSMIPIFHLIIGIVMLAGVFDGNSPQNSPPAFLGVLFMGIALFIMLIGFICAACLITAGRFLVRRKKHLFCLIVAGFSCLFVPLGTILGVFTIVVLMRTSVKELFGIQAA